MAVVTTIKSTHIVTPAQRTRTGRVTLSQLDQNLSYVLPHVHFYHSSPENSIPSGAAVLSLLKDSLSAALVHFYPLAGRVCPSPGGHLQLDCNAAGAVILEAESDLKLDDFGDFTPRPEFNSLIPCVPAGTPLQESPLLLVQLTAFRCGGVSLGLLISHTVADGLSAFRFVTEWARLARGESISHAPSFDSTRLLFEEDAENAPDAAAHEELQPPPLLIGQSTAESERQKEAAITMLHLTKTQVEKLKSVANDGRGRGGGRYYSRYEAVAAHVWRCVCAARGHPAEQPTAMGIALEFRNRLGLPAEYFGNAAYPLVARARSGELTSNPLGYGAQRVREAIEVATAKFLQSGLRIISSNGKKDPILERKGKEPFYGNPNIGAISWMTLPIYGLDFGFGGNFQVSFGTLVALDGLNFILPGKGGASDGSVAVMSSLQVGHMEAYKRLFYQDFKDEN